MRVLVTGATGYIGGRLVPLLSMHGRDAFSDQDRAAAKNFAAAGASAGGGLVRDN